ncbi:MAG: sensor histidine kinase [Bacteroidales bacterium]|jgi:signal transduction histidine kinase|nr:sensor histidine kinase [Bacteroidales bacterium]
MSTFNILWFVSCALQVFAAVMAIKLTKLTKLNPSWLIICAGLIVMSTRSVIQIVNVFVPDFGFDTHEPYTIGSVVVSLCFAVGVFMIKNMFVLLGEAEARQREYEKMLLNTTIMTEENERRRFATELHDGLGPLLSSIKMGFSAVADDISDTGVRSNLEQAIGAAISTVREISNNMSPHILTNMGLRRAMTNFLGKIAFPKDMRVSYNISICDTRYSATKEIVMYRVFCELVNNTLKHADATAINFRLEERGGVLKLTYKDNGTGFDPATLTDEQRTGMGLYNIISRVTSIKGTYNFRTGGEVEPTDGPTEGQHGMIAEIEIPIKD